MKIDYPPRPDLPSLGAPTRVSQSPLWGLLEDFYGSRGVDAWTQTPYYVTNSAVTAKVYAELILALVRDLGRPVTVLEIGAGLGRLGHFLSRELERQRAYFGVPPLRLILSDSAEQNVRFWESHPGLAGVECVRWDPLRDEALPFHLDTPLVVLANYVFDSLPHDEFQIRFKRLLECQVELFASSPQPLVHRTYRTVSPDYYPDPAWNALLAGYLKSVLLGAVTIPVGALSVLRKLEALSPEGLALLASDRAYTTTATLAARERHDFDDHGGSFSYFVNFDALARFFGTALQTTHASPNGVHTLAGLNLPGPFPQFTYVFREHLDREGRINASSDMMALAYEERSEAEEARGLTAFLRENLADPNCVAACARRLLATVRYLSPSEQDDLETLLREADASHFAFPGAVDLDYLLARIYAEMARHDRALVYVERALAKQPRDYQLLCFHARTREWLGYREED